MYEKRERMGITSMNGEKAKWFKPELTLINIKKYEKAILANANSICGYGCSTGGGGGGCSSGCSCSCSWNVICTTYTK